MYFKKLELIGFKSFYSKTTLHFEPGLTAVVGPNGCGKSNVFDSIRWVLGEQSVKSLRGSSMEDVIFSGTDLKEPLSMAEVSLTFDNSNKFFPVDYNEIIITRRIFRSGESEYLLNKTQVRLKDILDLLMGTGVGAESYSLIPQGKIDMILSSRPEDRRMVFDEASGITKYKSQKKEALRRLEETEQNLLRVNDIIAEVKRQINSLERQANKARRYKEVFEELKSKEVTLATAQKKELEKNKAEIKHKLSNSQSQEVEIMEIIREQETGIAGSRAELKNTEDALLNLKNEIINLNNLISRNKERVNLNQERIIELDANKKQLLAQLEQAKGRLITDEEKLNSLKEEYTSVKKNIEEKTIILKEKEIQLNKISSAIKLSLENIATAKKNILELVTKIANIKNGLSDLTSKQQIYLARKKRLEIETAKINEEKASIETNLVNIKEEVNNLEGNFQALGLKISEIKSGLDTENSSLTNIDSQIENLEKQKLAFQSQKQFLEELKTKYEDISESMNAVIYLDKLPQDKISGLVVRIKDYLNFNDEDRELAGLGNLKLSGEAKPFDLDTQNINERISQIEQKIDSLKNSKLEKENHIRGLEKSLSELQNMVRNQEIAIANKKTYQQSTLEQFNKIKDEEELISIELSDVEKELTVINERLSNLQLQLSELDNKQKLAENSISNEQDSISLNNNLKQETLVILTQVKTELDTLTKRIGSEDNNLKTLEERYRQDKESLANFEKQIKDSDSKQQSLKSEIEELENKLVQINLDIETRNAALLEAENKHKQISGSLVEVIRKIELDKKELDNLKNKLYELQMQNKDLEFKYLSIKDRLLQAYKIDLDLIADTASQTPMTIEENALLDEIRKLKEKLDSYGTVNLVAIEEYDELKKRYDFLTQQQNDLITAKGSLHEAILKVNRTTKKMFLETFEKVRVEFRNYFKLLFNGGDAQIYLIDEADPLESGIEIICRPPGKKLQNVLLLSGGEKAMSAIALIFAIFKVKPTPFCVLDEIDAALDEANVDRFSRALQEFTKISQFIVITHNKKTIANADIMYGITMEESGISKIVSVKFAQDKTIKQDKNPDTQPVAEPV